VTLSQRRMADYTTCTFGSQCVQPSLAHHVVHHIAVLHLRRMGALGFLGDPANLQVRLLWQTRNPGKYCHFA
jgi:hypothetical protein